MNQHHNFPQYLQALEAGRILCEFKGRFSHDKKIEILQELELLLANESVKTRKRVFLVALELMENALKHGMPDGPVEVRISQNANDYYVKVGNWTSFSRLSEHEMEAFMRSIERLNEMNKEEKHDVWQKIVTTPAGGIKGYSSIGLATISRYLNHPITYRIESGIADRHWLEVLAVVGE